MEGQVEGVKALPLAVGCRLSTATSSNVAGCNVGITTIGQNAVINSDGCRGSDVNSEPVQDKGWHVAVKYNQ